MVFSNGAAGSMDDISVLLLKAFKTQHLSASLPSGIKSGKQITHVASDVFRRYVCSPWGKIWGLFVNFEFSKSLRIASRPSSGTAQFFECLTSPCGVRTCNTKDIRMEKDILATGAHVTWMTQRSKLQIFVTSRSKCQDISIRVVWTLPFLKLVLNLPTSSKRWFKSFKSFKSSGTTLPPRHPFKDQGQQSQ